MIYQFIQKSKDGTLDVGMGGGDCLCKWQTWNSEYFWLEITIQGFTQTVILWLLSGQFSILPEFKTQVCLCAAVFPIISKIALLFSYIVLVFLFGTNFIQLENNFVDKLILPLFVHNSQKLAK